MNTRLLLGDCFIISHSSKLHTPFPDSYSQVMILLHFPRKLKQSEV